MMQQIMQRMAEMQPDKAEWIARQLDAAKREDEAWKVAQLAATLHSGLSAGGNEILIVDVVKAAFAILAESRRQVAASRPAPEGRPDAE